jgi:hypothetical protein
MNNEASSENPIRWLSRPGISVTRNAAVRGRVRIKLRDESLQHRPVSTSQWRKEWGFKPI